MPGFYESDLEVMDRLSARRAQEQYRANVSPSAQMADLLALFQQTYPTISPSLAVSLAAAGADPFSPEVQVLVGVDAEKQQQDGGGFFDSVGDVLSGSIGAVTGAVKPAIRTGFVALESGLQEVQAIIRAGGYAGVHLAERDGHDGGALERLRNLLPDRWDEQVAEFADAYGDAGTSTGREALSDLLHGKRVDLGTGFFGGGQIKERQVARGQRLTLQVGKASFGGPNPAISAGRVIAARVTEPGTTQYNALSGLVDAGVAWFGDPVNAGLAKAADVGAANRVGRATRAFRESGFARAAEELGTHGRFAPVVDRSLQSRAAERLGTALIPQRLSDGIHDTLGMVGATRKTVQPVYTDQWLTKGGRRLVQKVTETTDFTDLWDATRGQLGAKLTRQLADATDEQSVMDLLRGSLGTDVTQAPEFLGYRVGRYSERSVRLLGDMPGAFIDPNNLDQGVKQLDSWLRNAKVSPEVRRESLDLFVRGTSREEIVTTLTDKIMPKVAEELAGKIKGRGGLSPQTRAGAKHLTRMWNQQVEASRAYFIDEIAENRQSAGVMVAGKQFDTQSPWLFTEFLNSLVPLPDAREIRRATSKLSRFVDNPVFTESTAALDSLMGGWKRITLLRGAYTVRVIGEEQVRMAASGLDSMFAHPLSFIAALVGDPRATRRLVEGADVVGESAPRRLLRRAGANADLRRTDVLGEEFSSEGMVELQQALNKGWSGWVDRTVFDRFHTIFKRGEDGYDRAWRQGIAELSNDPVAREVARSQGNLDEVKRWFWNEKGRNIRKRMVEAHPELATPEGADAYVELLWEGVQYRTASDPTLMEAIATRKINGKSLGRLDDRGAFRPSDDLIAYLETSGVVGPEAIKGQRAIEAGRASLFDNATGMAFLYLNTKPTNFLSRSPTFRQHYWDRMEAMLPHMDDATRQATLAAADGVVPTDQLRRMRQAGRTKGAATVTALDDADTVAKAIALDETKKLLYDLSQKGQFFDTFRLLFPFGEAWKEVMGRWAQIGAQNPKVLRRGQQLITGARGADLDGDGQGFFHKDVNGEEVFTYPFSRNFSKFVTGVPVDFNGRVAGLSLMTELAPGVGPVVQLPAAAIVPETPSWDWVREIVSPYGPPNVKSGILEAFAPGYARNIMQFFEKGDERLFGNAVGSAMDYLASTGDYDLRSPDDRIRANETQRLVDDATKVAKQTYLLRGMLQWGAPTSPLPEWLVKDKNDDLAIAREVIQDFYRLQQSPEDGGVGYDNAVGEFLDRYGTNNFLLTQPKSYSVIGALPVNKEAARWERENTGLVRKYDKVWGFFAPQGEVESFDYQAYLRQFQRGDRIALDPEQRVSLAQAKIGQYIYDQAKTKVSEKPNAVEREWLAAVKQQLRIDYPGFGERTVGLPSRANTEQLVAQLRLAVDDPKLATTTVAQAARIYIAARDRALAYARDLGVRTLGAEAATPAREWLASVGDRLRAQYPEFGEMFDMVFSREVTA